MTSRAAFAASLAVAVASAGAARAQRPTQLPPPPPPSTAPQYVPPPPPSQIPPPRHDQPAPRRERPPPAAPDAPPPPPHRYVPPPSERVDRDEAPDARTGFQLALRTGVSLPGGSVSGQNADSMSNVFKAQVPLFVELGIKVTPNIFLGGFTSLAFGGAGNDFRARGDCPTNAARSCLAVDFRIGVEAQYHFQPDARWNPWVGLGLGFESATASASGGGPSASENVTGFEFFKLSGGVDYRLTRAFGLGPFVGLDVGQYSHAHAEAGGNVADGSITNPALHEWVTIGVRGVFFP